MTLAVINTQESRNAGSHIRRPESAAAGSRSPRRRADNRLSSFMRIPADRVPPLRKKLERSRGVSHEPRFTEGKEFPRERDGS